MNLLRGPDGKLDRKGLRVAAVYRLLKAKRIGYARAVAILGESCRNTIELWRAWSLKDMLP